MQYLTSSNHGEHFNPHPQYDLFNTITTQNAPDSDKLWVKLMEKTLRYDVTGATGTERNCLRRIGLDGYVFDNVSEAQSDYALLHLYVYATKHQQDDGSYVVANLGLNPVYSDYTKYYKNNLYNPSYIFQLFAHDTGAKDSEGVPIYTVSLYGKVQGFYSTISIQPTSLHLATAGGGSFDSVNVDTNPNANGRDRINALLGGMATADFITEDEMDAKHKGDVAIDTNHPSQAQAYEQVDRNNNGTGEVDLLPYTTMLTVAPKADFKNWPMKVINPSPWQDQQGFELTVLSFGNVNFVNSALFAQENNEDGGIALRGKTDTLLDAGTIIKLVRYDNYWIQV